MQAKTTVPISSTLIFPIPLTYNPLTPHHLGPPLPWIQKLYTHWLHTFSWPTASAQISQWHHYTTTISSLTVHFIHEKARVRQDTAIPLLLIHGWPGTFFEFQNVMTPLLYGSDDESASVFDLVIPSLPGFCWSQGPPRGWTLQDTAGMYDELMQRLGYTSYVAQAGDWGHWVVRELGSGRFPGCKAVHTNMCPGAPPEGAKLTDKEKRGLERAKWWIGEKLDEGHMGYAIEMRTRPQTIGVAFNGAF
jgi:pimeloyl-ACP methyl ester carboxylesterase